MMDDREQARALFWRRRDKGSYRCPGCGRGRDQMARLDVHHLDGNPANNSPDNLVALCKRCHLGGQHDRTVEEEHLSPPLATGVAPPAPRDLTPGP